MIFAIRNLQIAIILQRPQQLFAEWLADMGNHAVPWILRQLAPFILLPEQHADDAAAAELPVDIGYRLQNMP